MDTNTIMKHAHASRLAEEVVNISSNLKEGLGDMIQYLNMLDKTVQQLQAITEILFKENDKENNIL